MHQNKLRIAPVLRRAMAACCFQMLYVYKSYLQLINRNLSFETLLMFVTWRPVLLLIICIANIHSFSFAQQNSEAITVIKRIDSLRLQKNPSLPLNRAARAANTGAANVTRTTVKNKQFAYTIQKGFGNDFIACFDTSGKSSIGQDSVIFYAGQRSTVGHTLCRVYCQRCNYFFYRLFSLPPQAA